MNVREGFVDIEGHRLAYLAVNEHLASSDQPVVVFIHGVLASVNFWRDAVPPDVREHRAWYALSLPAHHPSTVPADFVPGQVNEAWFYRLMNGALEQLLDGRRAIVVGHSTGGFCALNLAIHRAPSVVGVVSVAGFHRGRWGGVEGMLLTLAGLGRWAWPLFALNLLIARHSKLVQRVFATLLAHDRKAFRASPLSQRMLDNIRPDTRRQDLAALFTLFQGIGTLTIGHRLRELDIPCFVFAGTHDPVVSATQSLLIAGEVPTARLVVFHDVGHMPFMEATAAYFRALECAVRQLARGDGGRRDDLTRRETSDGLSRVSGGLAAHP